MVNIRILVVGGYGFFGRRLVERLARDPGRQIVVAGRSLAAAQASVRALQSRATAALEAVALDVHSPTLTDDLRRIAPAVVINASGPFQGQDYRVPLACIAAGVHHIDLADSRTYVNGIVSLQDAAAAAGVFVTSGASSVPALSSAAADHLTQGLVRVDTIDIGISPGNRTERGLSTVQGILSYCGKALPSSGKEQVFGWSGVRRQMYPAPVGPRLLSPCDVPDLSLLPLRYAGVPQVRFGAGLELEFLHRGMNLMAWTARVGLVRDWSSHASLLKLAADWFRRWGSDAGAMHVSVAGSDPSGVAVWRTWTVVARDNDGPYVPTLAAAALVRKLENGALPAGACPCVGLLSLGDFATEADGLRITMEPAA